MKYSLGQRRVSGYGFASLDKTDILLFEGGGNTLVFPRIVPQLEVHYLGRYI